MASKGGPWVMGTDGSDFAHRQKIASQYQMSAIYKSRLRFCIIMHFMVFMLMLAKLSPNILDRLNIFILQIEELYIPDPRLWEWVWTSSILFSFLGLSGMRRNKVSHMRIYALGIFLFGLCSLIAVPVVYFTDLKSIFYEKNYADVEKWRTYPVSLLWLIFTVVALQVHICSVVSACQLIRSWEMRGTKKAA